MMTHTMLFLLLLVGLESVLGSVLVRKYKIISNHMTWADAQRYCKSSAYIDLATVSSQTDAFNMFLQQFSAWIGLYRTSPSSSWIFLSGNSVTVTFQTWAPTEPKEDDLCAVVQYPERLAYGVDCDSHHFAYCDYYVYSETENIHVHRLAFVSLTMTWAEARQFCMSEYRTVADMYSTSAREENFPVWIGLYRQGGTWSWSTGKTNFTLWDMAQPSTGDCAAITSMSKTMVTKDCSSLLPFTCFSDNLVLVKENKTWEEALEHCSSMGTHPTHYRLLSVQPGDDHTYVTSRLTEATTDQVWVGLRFLVDQWQWVDGVSMSWSDLPECTSEGHRCGSVSTDINSNSVELMDCLNTYNFVCYT